MNREGAKVAKWVTQRAAYCSLLLAQEQAPNFLAENK